ncbi:MAG: glycosyltransferase family 4 protein [Bacteroidales bacterium]|jgi:glycosyltransferase involved in cell wall biosynthesis
MRILLINHYAGSSKLGMEYRPYYLAKEWVKNGHDVTIIASSFSHVRSVQPEVKSNFETQNIDGIKYIWLKTKAYQGNSIKRFFNILEFVFKLFFKSSYIAKTFKPDVVIASSTYPLDIYPAYRIAKKAKAKLVYEIHDLWPLSPMEIGGYSKRHPLIILMQAAEKFCYKKSDLVISILPKTLEHCVSHGLEPTKWHHIPNGISLERSENQQEIPIQQKNILEQIRIAHKYIIGYTGSIGSANAVKDFILAAYLLKNENVAFVVIGKGAEKENLEKLKNENNLRNVYFIEPVPKKSILKVLNILDFLFIGLKKQNLFRFGVSPNKLFDYMLSGKPIIQAIDAGNDIVSEAKCGFTIEPENPQAIAGAIRKIIALPQNEIIEMGKNGKDYVIQNHDYKIIANKFLEIIK